MSNISIWVVLVAAASSFLLGGFWYSKAFLGVSGTERQAAVISLKRDIIPRGLRLEFPFFSHRRLCVCSLARPKSCA